MAGIHFVLTLMVVLTLFVALSQPGEDGTHAPSTDESGATCQEFQAVLVHDLIDGVQVTMSSSATQNTSVITIPGKHLPEECGPSYKRCNVLTISSDTHLFGLFSVREGIVIVDYNQTTLEYISHFVFKTPLACNPTAIFLLSETSIYQLFTACISHANGNSYFQYFQFRFGKTNITTASFRNSPISVRERIYDPDSLSFVYTRNQRDCLSASNVYVLDEGYVTRFLADVGQRRFIDPTRVCPELKHLSVEYHGDNLLLVRCSNDTALTFDTCRGVVISHYQSSESGLPYPCSDWNTVAVVKDGNLTFNTSEISEVDNSTNLTLPAGNIENAQCVGGNQNTIFVFTVNREITYAYSVSDNLLLEIVPLSCNSTKCFKPIVLSAEGASIVGAYNYESSRFVVVNPTCTLNPVVLDLPVIRPDLAALFPGRTRHSCQCEPITEPSPITSPVTTETEQTSPTTTVPSTESSATTDQASSDHTTTTPVVDDPIFAVDPLAASITSPVAVFVFVVVVVVALVAVAVFWHRKFPKRRQNSRVNILSSLPSSVRQSVELWPVLMRYGPVQLESGEDEDIASVHSQPAPPTSIVEMDQRYGPVQLESGEDEDIASINSQPAPPTSIVEMDQWTGSVQPEPQESGFYGDLDIREVVPVVDSNRGDVDVAGIHNAPMPPDRYHLISVAEIEQRRCSTEEKRNDFQGKQNAFQADLGGAND